MKIISEILREIIVKIILIYRDNNILIYNKFEFLYIDSYSLHVLTKLCYLFDKRDANFEIKVSR